MLYTIVFASFVVKEDVPTLDDSVFARAREAIDTKLKTHPAVFGKPLRYSLRNYRSLRVGDFRIVYKIEHTIVHIAAIIHLRDVYIVMQKRI